MVITGSKRAYILNAFVYDPTSSWHASSPQSVMAGMSESTTITAPASKFSGHLNKVG